MHRRYKQYYNGTSVGCWFYSRYACINKNILCTGPEGFGKFQYSRHVKVVRSALRTGHLYLHKRIMIMKNSNDIIGNRTRDLPACSSVPQPTASPRSAIHVSNSNILSPDRTVWKRKRIRFVTSFSLKGKWTKACWGSRGFSVYIVVFPLTLYLKVGTVLLQ
jgi:hypothetical protein